eukprot:scaffold1924_cov140-Skeletonema_menzelii.AAC.21
MSLTLNTQSGSISLFLEACMVSPTANGIPHHYPWVESETDYRTKRIYLCVCVGQRESDSHWRVKESGY